MLINRSFLLLDYSPFLLVRYFEDSYTQSKCNFIICNLNDI
ncbi:hypothetical protein HanPI659440_Chr13g0499981 [Helianthus annuus]|nr:hypothetical protein HanPI659440_Chr13g0499981 [Helianthus annuus]